MKDLRSQIADAIEMMYQTSTDPSMVEIVDYLPDDLSEHSPEELVEIIRGIEKVDSPLDRHVLSRVAEGLLLMAIVDGRFEGSAFPLEWAELDWVWYPISLIKRVGYGHGLREAQLVAGLTNRPVHEVNVHLRMELARRAIRKMDKLSDPKSQDSGYVSLYDSEILAADWLVRVYPFLSERSVIKASEHPRRLIYDPMNVVSFPVGSPILWTEDGTYGHAYVDLDSLPVSCVIARFDDSRLDVFRKIGSRSWVARSYDGLNFHYAATVFGWVSGRNTDCIVQELCFMASFGKTEVIRALLATSDQHSDPEMPL